MIIKIRYILNRRKAVIVKEMNKPKGNSIFFMSMIIYIIHIFSQNICLENLISNRRQSRENIPDCQRIRLVLFCQYLIE